MAFEEIFMSKARIYSTVTYLQFVELPNSSKTMNKARIGQPGRAGSFDAYFFAEYCFLPNRAPELVSRSSSHVVKDKQAVPVYVY